MLLRRLRPRFSPAAKHRFTVLSASPRPFTTSRTLNKMDETAEGDKRSHGNEPHRYQAGSTTDREKDQWKLRAPYRIRDEGEQFEVKWRGKCHCGAIQYQLSRDKPLASKYCHCTTCQRMHGVRTSLPHLVANTTRKTPPTCQTGG